MQYSERILLFTIISLYNYLWVYCWKKILEAYKKYIVQPTLLWSKCFNDVVNAALNTYDTNEFDLSQITFISSSEVRTATRVGDGRQCLKGLPWKQHNRECKINRNAFCDTCHFNKTLYLHKWESLYYPLVHKRRTSKSENTIISSVHCILKSDVEPGTIRRPVGWRLHFSPKSDLKFFPCQP